MLHYKIHSQGEETIILLHGYLSSSTYWQHLIPLLTSQYRVITIDLLGFGNSPKPSDSLYTLDDHAIAVLKTLDAIDCKSITIVGHSMGSLVAARVAQLLEDEPITIHRLIMFNPPVLTSKDEARDVFANTSKLYKLMLYSPAGKVAWPIMHKLATSPLTRLAPRTLKPVARSSAKNTHNSRRRSLYNTIEITNGIQLLSELSIPTTVVNGLKDRPIYRQNLAEYAHELPSHVKITWEDAGHHFPAKMPQAALAYLIRSLTN